MALVMLTGCSGQDQAATPPAATPSTAAVSSSVATESFNLNGSLRIADLDGFWYDGTYVGSACGGEDGYDDINEGTQVVVRDAGGLQVAVGELGPGSTDGHTRRDLTTTCEFPLLVFGVPTGSAIYTVEVAHRGEVSFPVDEMQDHIELTLG